MKQWQVVCKMQQDSVHDVNGEEQIIDHWLPIYKAPAETPWNEIERVMLEELQKDPNATLKHEIFYTE